MSAFQPKTVFLVNLAEKFVSKAVCGIEDCGDAAKNSKCFLSDFDKVQVDKVFEKVLNKTFDFWMIGV